MKKWRMAVATDETFWKKKKLSKIQFKKASYCQPAESSYLVGKLGSLHNISTKIIYIVWQEHASLSRVCLHKDT